MLTSLLALIFLAIAISFWWLARFIPTVSDDRPLTPITREKFDEKYHLWKWAAFPVLLICWIACTITWGAILLLFRSTYHNALTDTEVLVTPIVSYEVLAIACLGIFTVTYPILGVWRIVLRDDYEEFVDYQMRAAHNAGFQASWNSRIGIPLALFYCFFWIDCYARVTPVGFVENGFYQLGEIEHPLAEIQEKFAK